MVNFIKKLIWFLQNKSTCCGAEIEVWDSKKAYCKACGERE